MLPIPPGSSESLTGSPSEAPQLVAIREMEGTISDDRYDDRTDLRIGSLVCRMFRLGEKFSESAVHRPNSGRR